MNYTDAQLERLRDLSEGLPPRQRELVEWAVSTIGQQRREIESMTTSPYPWDALPLPCNEPGCGLHRPHVHKWPAVQT